MAEHIVAKIEIRCSEEMANPTKPSISLGVSTKKHIDQDINSIYKHAEDRMYINKLKDSNDIKDSIILSLRKKLQEPFQEDN
jgi:GGDEF domain-containing protein